MSEQLKRAAELLREQAEQVKCAHMINGAWPALDRADEHAVEAYRDYQALREAATDVEKAAAELLELSAKAAELKERNNELLTERNQLGLDIEMAAQTGRVPEGHRMVHRLQLVAKLVDELSMARGRIAALEAQAAPEIWRDVLAEVERATRKFPTWPTDPLHAVAVLGEEFGELTKAVLQTVYEPHKVKDGELRTEAVQTAAMALRFLSSLGRYEFARCEQHEQPAPVVIGFDLAAPDGDKTATLVASNRCPDLTMFHVDRAELLRDSANSRGILDGSTVPVNREALEALRAALANYAVVHHWMCDKEREAGALNVISAANHLLDGGE